MSIRLISKTKSPIKKILKFVSRTIIPKTERPFNPKKHFKMNSAFPLINPFVSVRIQGVELDLREYALDQAEEPVSEQILICSQLHLEVLGGTRKIIQEIGGEASSEITLAELFYLMKINRNRGKGSVLQILWNEIKHFFFVLTGQSDSDLSKNYGNIVHVRNIYNELCPIYIDWDLSAWNLRYRDNIDHGSRYTIRTRVFYREKAEETLELVQATG